MFVHSRTVDTTIYIAYDILVINPSTSSHYYCLALSATGALAAIRLFEPQLRVAGDVMSCSKEHGRICNCSSADSTGINNCIYSRGGQKSLIIICHVRRRDVIYISHKNLPIYGFLSPETSPLFDDVAAAMCD